MKLQEAIYSIKFHGGTAYDTFLKKRKANELWKNNENQLEAFVKLTFVESIMFFCGCHVVCKTFHFTTIQRSCLFTSEPIV